MNMTEIRQTKKTTHIQYTLHTILNCIRKFANFVDFVMKTNYHYYIHEIKKKIMNGIQECVSRLMNYKK